MSSSGQEAQVLLQYFDSTVGLVRSQLEKFEKSYGQDLLILFTHKLHPALSVALVVVSGFTLGFWWFCLSCIAFTALAFLLFLTFLLAVSLFIYLLTLPLFCAIGIFVANTVISVYFSLRFMILFWNNGKAGVWLWYSEVTAALITPVVDPIRRWYAVVRGNNHSSKNASRSPRRSMRRSRSERSPGTARSEETASSSEVVQLKEIKAEN